MHYLPKGIGIVVTNDSSNGSLLKAGEIRSCLLTENSNGVNIALIYLRIIRIR